MGIMITDPRQADNPIIHANLAFQQQSGYSIEELIGRNPRFLQGTDTDPESVAVLHNAVKQGRGCRVTLKNYRKDNTPVWIELALTPVFDDKGAPEYFIGIQTDVTDQRYSESIVQSHQRVLDKVSRGESLETVLQLLADGARTLEPALMTSILLVDEKNATMVCKAASGLPKDYVQAIDGLPIADSVGTCGTAIFRKQLVISEDLQKDPKWQNFRDIALQANLQACWSQPIITPAGKVLGSIAFYRDTASVPNERQLDLLRENAAHAALLIEKYLTEQALRDINAELEQRVIARSAEAVRANTEKSRFLNAASHDLRQPLQSSRFYIAALSQCTNERERDQLLKKLDSSSLVMSDLLDTLLDSSRLDSGAVEADTRDFPVQQLLDDVAVSCMPHAQSKQLTLIVEPSECVVHSDPALLQRIVENFVSNAVRYTEQGTVTVQCCCVDGSARLEVTDTGIGIPHSQQAEIFDEFHQLQDPVQDRNKGPGLGLGLFIVRQLADILGHPVSVRSDQGQGSTFSIDLPLGSVPVPLEPCALPVITPVVLSREPAVLIVDDDEAVLDSMSTILELSGIEVHGACSGSAAMSLVAGGLQPDVVVSDFQLPGRNGVELIQSIRQATQRPVPVVLMSGDTSSVVIENSDLNDCTLMRKPIDVDHLVSLIKSSVISGDSP